LGALAPGRVLLAGG